MHFPYGFPKALLTGVGAAEGAPIYLAASPGGDYIVAVFGTVLQARSQVLPAGAPACLLCQRGCWMAGGMAGRPRDAEAAVLLEQRGARSSGGADISPMSAPLSLERPLTRLPWAPRNRSGAAGSTG